MASRTVVVSLTGVVTHAESAASARQTPPRQSGGDASVRAGVAWRCFRFIRKFRGRLSASALVLFAGALSGTSPLGRPDARARGVCRLEPTSGLFDRRSAVRTVGQYVGCSRCTSTTPCCGRSCSSTWLGVSRPGGAGRRPVIRRFSPNTRRRLRAFCGESGRKRCAPCLLCSPCWRSTRRGR